MLMKAKVMHGVPLHVHSPVHTELRIVHTATDSANQRDRTSSWCERDEQCGMPPLTGPGAHHQNGIHACRCTSTRGRGHERNDGAHIRENQQAGDRSSASRSK